MKRSLSATVLLFASISAIIGSGWLFSAYYSATVAGPAAILSWVIGGGAMIVVAFIFAEVCAMLPLTGSSTRIPQFTHGSIVSFVFAWIIWLSYATYISAETQAVIQYLCFYFPILTNPITGALTLVGFVFATILLFLVSVINVYSLRWLMRLNVTLTVLKMIIPVFIAVVLMIMLFHSHSIIHPGHGDKFMPYGMHGVLYAIASAGIIFAFNGFKQAAEMAGEAKNPGRTVPIAVIGSVIICLLIYVILQIAFLGSLEPANLVSGWHHLVLRGQLSPYAAILVEHKINWLLPILYIAALSAPLAAGMMYFSSATRSLYAMSKNGYVPLIFQKVNIYDNPFYAVIANFIVGMFLFAPLPGWDKLATFLGSLLAMSYAVGPITLLALRKQVPLQNRPFRLRLPKILSLIAFYICTLLIYWSGWNIISKVGIAIFVGFIVLFSYHFFTKRGSKQKLNWYASLWLWPYLIGITVISYLGNFGGGRGILPFGWDFLVITIFSVIILWLSLIFKLPAIETQEYVDHLHLNLSKGE